MNRRQFVVASSFALAGLGTPAAAQSTTISPGLLAVEPPRALPPFELPDVAGKIVRSPDLLGNVLILRFWATW